MVLNLQEMHYIFTKKFFFSRWGGKPSDPLSYGVSDVNPPPYLKAGSAPELSPAVLNGQLELVMNIDLFKITNTL